MQAAAEETSAPARTPRKRARQRRSIAYDVLPMHLGYCLRRAQVAVFQDFIRTLAPLDLRPAQFSVLVVIAANPGLSQAELADALAIERARLVHMLDRLQARGLLRRLMSATDRRSHALHLTREGQKTLKRAKALAAAHEARLSAMLGGETRDSVMRLLGAFIGSAAPSRRS